MVLNQEAIRRMINGGASSVVAVSGGGGGGGLSPAWVEENYVSKAFFNQLFTIHGTKTVTDEETGTTTVEEVEITPNQLIDDEYDVTDVEVKFGLWTQQFLSALGKNSSGGGGGGGDTLTEPLASINNAGLGTPTAAGQAIVWNGKSWTFGTSGGTDLDAVWAALADSTSEQINATHLSNALSGYATQSWVNNQGFLKSETYRGTVTSVGTGTGLTGGPITDSGTISISQTYRTYIANGQTAYGWGNHANAGYLTSSDIQDMATKTWVANQGYATQSWVNQQGFLKSVSGTFWGNSWSNGGTLSGNIIIDNGYAIRFKNSSGDNKNVLTLNSANQLAIGYNTRQMGYVTDIQGDPIIFATNNGTTGGTDNRLEVGEFSSAGRFWIKQGTQGLRIGNGLLTWDSANNALKVSDYNGNSANLYALGGVSALGFSSSGGTSSINSLTVNDSILVKDYSGNSKKALSVTLAASASEASKLIIGEGWKDLYHDTVIRGYNIRFDTGQHDAAVTINGTGLATFNYNLKSSRYYLDGSRYIYLDGTTLKYYNGSQSKTIVLS